MNILFKICAVFMLALIWPVVLIYCIFDYKGNLTGFQFLGGLGAVVILTGIQIVWFMIIHSFLTLLW